MKLKDEPAVEAEADSDRQHCKSDVQWHQLFGHLISIIIKIITIIITIIIIVVDNYDDKG